MQAAAEECIMVWEDGVIFTDQAWAVKLSARIWGRAAAQPQAAVPHALQLGTEIYLQAETGGYRSGGFAVR